MPPKQDVAGRRDQASINISVRLPVSLVARYDEVTNRTGVSRSQLIRAALEEHVSKTQRAADVLTNPIVRQIMTRLSFFGSADQQRELSEMYRHLDQQLATFDPSKPDPNDDPPPSRANLITEF